MSVLALGGVYLPNSPHPVAQAGDPYSTGAPAFISLLISLLISLPFSYNTSGSRSPISHISPYLFNYLLFYRFTCQLHFHLCLHYTCHRPRWFLTDEGEQPKRIIWNRFGLKWTVFVHLWRLLQVIALVYCHCNWNCFWCTLCTFPLLFIASF